MSELLVLAAALLGLHIQYIHARPYQRAALIEPGLVVGYQIRRNELYLKITPDNPAQLSKWIETGDILSRGSIIEKAAA